MSDSAGKTPQSNESQTAKPGAAQPPTSEVDIPAPTKEPFLVINVREGANTDEIVKAVSDALRVFENPFFQYDTPLVAQARARHRGAKYERKSMVPGEALMMMVRQEGW